MAPSGTQARFRANLAALQTLRALQAQDRTATAEEQAVLARWSGWGATGLAEVFNEARPEFEPERQELRQVLNEAEYRAASRTTLNAHYTNPDYVRVLWDVVQGLGFAGGEVLEPGSGIGTFIGLAPEGARMTGVELDPVTAGISQHLYPQASIRAESFADSRFPSGIFDAAIGNVPFERLSLHDSRHNAGGHSMHNHFIIKSLDLVRPGGIVAVLTSSFTLDAQNPQARREMAAVADLVGAVRLPNGAHRRSAGTEALTDVVILRRRHEHEQPRDTSWVEASLADVDGGTARMNRYFLEHPENVLGELHVGMGMYGAEQLQVTADPATIPAALAGQLHELTTEALTTGLGVTERAGEIRVDPAAILPVSEAPEVGHIIAADDGTFTQISVDGAPEPLKVPRTQAGELRALLGLRDSARAVLTLEAASLEDTIELDAARQTLRDRYAGYTAQWGPINRYKTFERKNDDGTVTESRRAPGAVALVGRDPFGPLVKALENFDDSTQTATPASLLTQRQILPRTPRLGADTPDEALALSLDATGGVDLGYIAQLLGHDDDLAAARADLGTLVFDVPGTEDVLETRAEYLSGNVRVKLDAARASEDPRHQVNVAALEEVLPTPLGAGDIEPRIGAVWISAEHHEQFLREILRDRTAHVDRLVGAEWDVKANRYSVASTSTWGTERMSAGEIFKHTLEQRRIQVTDPDPADPKNKRVLNPVETAAANEKAEMLQERFSEWVWENPERAATLVDEYNRRFNSIVLRDYSAEGERLSLPGLVKSFTPRPHQRTAVAGMISDPAVGLFHEVGAGKTAEMVMGCMELKRLGLVSKPAVVVPNHMLEQVSREWLQLYPQAKFLPASSADLQGAKRREFVARAAASDWDAVILTHDSFGLIGLSKEAEQDYAQRLIATQREALERANGRAVEAGASLASIKRIENRLAAQEEKIKARLDRRTDPGVSFELTGIDYLVVDEMHKFKNLNTISNIQDAAIEGSKKASDLEMKVQWLRETHGERVITGATATPIANSVTELHVMQRYLRPDLLEEAGVLDFDSWAATFGSVTREMEMGVTGNFKMKDRFAKFQNVPELLKMFHTFADVKTAEDLKLPVPDLAVREDGQRLPRLLAVEPSEELREYIQHMGERAEDIQAGRVDGSEDNWLKLSGDGRKAALDLRLVLPQVPEDQLEQGKIVAAADEIARVYEANKARVFLDPATQEHHPTPGALQLVFCDQSTPKKDGTWNAYQELKDQLVARGVPAEKIRFMHEATNDAAKGRLFAAARAGEVAVLVGSTEKMGMGTNVQDRAVHLVDLDAPWRPADISQRHGRIIRQHNQNPVVEITQVVTKESFDTFMWQTLERKSKFIDQVMRGRLDVREIEDLGDNTLSYAEVKAISSGNPLLLEKAKADQELAKLERLQRAWQRNNESLLWRVASGRKELETAQHQIPRLQAAVERTRVPEDFQIRIDGYTWDSRADAADALRAWALRNASIAPPRTGERDLGIIGSLNGHDLRVIQHQAYAVEIGMSQVEVRIEDAPTQGVLVSRNSFTSSGIGTIQRLENRIAKLPDLVVEAQSRAAEAERTIADAEANMGAPFKHTDKLQEARNEVQRISDLLAPPEQAQDQLPVVEPALPAPRLMSRLERLTVEQNRGNRSTIRAAHQAAVERQAQELALDAAARGREAEL